MRWRNPQAQRQFLWRQGSAPAGQDLMIRVGGWQPTRGGLYGVTARGRATPSWSQQMTMTGVPPQTPLTKSSVAPRLPNPPKPAPNRIKSIARRILNPLLGIFGM